MKKLYVLVCLISVLLMCGCRTTAVQQPTQAAAQATGLAQVNIPATNKWGGPYKPSTYVGKPIDDSAYLIQWDSAGKVLNVNIPSSHQYGMTYSIELHSGTFQITGECGFYLDADRNGNGDKNPRVRDVKDQEAKTFTLSNEGWGVIYMPADSTTCKIAMQS